MPGFIVAIVSIGLIWIILVDAFETIVLPRRVTRRVRLARQFYQATWAGWSKIARQMRDEDRRGNFLGLYGPLSLILLLVLWAVGMVTSFSLLYWGLSIQLNGSDGSGPTNLGNLFYMSGITFFTIGYGDVTPHDGLGRTLTVIEGGIGFGFLALVIGYLPVIYQSFSRREANISLLDGQAGSPPTAGELLTRHCGPLNDRLINEFLRDWERWSSELLESHLSYPVLAYFRSQHENQSWLAAFTVILDTCALVMTGIEGIPVRQARMTFAIARHAVVDLAQVFNTIPTPPKLDRLPPADLAQLVNLLNSTQVGLDVSEIKVQLLADIRHSYEPFINALAEYLLFDIPPFFSAPDQLDNWQTSAWPAFDQYHKV